MPPIFDGESFRVYAEKQSRVPFISKWSPYVSYDSMRNTNTPRCLGIPTPMSYELLCACLRDNWDKILKHFEETTALQTHVVSRIHVRKAKGTEALFQMNYKNWRDDGSPEPDLILGKNYVVHADISKCFPSIYTHALSWALVGKTEAKTHPNDKKLWYNAIDTYAQKTKNGETHGVLIGPHAANILSEIILCKVDETLCKKWDYIRNIDDYCCYVDTQEDADAFLVDLNKALREYGLLLNHKKTEILELPIGTVEHWVNQLQNKAVYLGKFQPYVDYREVQSFLDYCIELMNSNKENASIILYGLKVLSKHTMTSNATTYLKKRIVALSLQYPYIVPLLDEYVISKSAINPCELEKYLCLIYEKYVNKDYYEACSFALLYATKYGARINCFNVDEVIRKKDCILALLSLIYCRKHGLTAELDKLKTFAKKLKADEEFEEYWPFCYECLTVGYMKEDWKKLKQANISFLKPEYH